MHSSRVRLKDDYDRCCGPSSLFTGQSTALYWGYAQLARGRIVGQEDITVVTIVFLSDYQYQCQRQRITDTNWHDGCVECLCSLSGTTANRSEFNFGRHVQQNGSRTSGAKSLLKPSCSNQRPWIPQHLFKNHLTSSVYR